MALISNPWQQEVLSNWPRPHDDDSRTGNAGGTPRTEFHVTNMTDGTGLRGVKKSTQYLQSVRVPVTALLWIHDLALSASRPDRAGRSTPMGTSTSQWNRAACQAIVELASELFSAREHVGPALAKSDNKPSGRAIRARPGARPGQARRRAK
jgi:hypothetical protein